MTLLIQLGSAEGTNQPRAIEHPVLAENFRMLYPDTSFPAVLTPELVERYGFGIYDYQPMPAFDFATQKIIELDPEKEEESGIWRQQWEVIDLTDDEKLQRKNTKMIEIRGQRNFKLAICDWTQLPDAVISKTLKASYKVYRQELRDLLNATNFNPFDFLWPIEPSESLQAAPEIV